MRPPLVRQPSRDLEPLSVLGARSFWYAIATVAHQILLSNGVDVPELLGTSSVSSAFGILWEIAVPIVLVIGVLYERRAPQRRLTIRGPLK